MIATSALMCNTARLARLPLVKMHHNASVRSASLAMAECRRQWPTSHPCLCPSSIASDHPTMADQLVSLLQQLKARLSSVAADPSEAVQALDLVPLLHDIVQSYQYDERTAPRLRE